MSQHCCKANMWPKSGTKEGISKCGHKGVPNWSQGLSFKSQYRDSLTKKFKPVNLAELSPFSCICNTHMCVNVLHECGCACAHVHVEA